MNYLGSEVILKRKIGPLMGVYVMIIIVIMLSLIIFFVLFHYKTYYFVKGTIVLEDNNYYTDVYVPIDDEVYITKNNVAIIDGKKYEYSIFDIAKEYYTDNNVTYQRIRLKIGLSDYLKFNNLTVDLKILKEDKRIIDYLLKGGI